jgi:hypothetical protein
MLERGQSAAELRIMERITVEMELQECPRWNLMRNLVHKRPIHKAPIAKIRPFALQFAPAAHGTSWRLQAH